MKNKLDQLIDLAKVFNSDVAIRKNVDGEYLVSIARVSWRENRHDIMARSMFSTGDNIFEACDNYLNLARGRLLFGDDERYYGKDRPEYLCV